MTPIGEKNTKHIQLENGPKSLSQSWYMNALYQRWKKMKGYKEPEPPDCSSSMKEWEESIKKYEK